CVAAAPPASPSQSLRPGAGPPGGPFIDGAFETVLPAAPKQRIALWLLIGLVIFLVVGLMIAQVDIIISANGKLATSDSEIVLQPLETAIVRSVAVKAGQKVKKEEGLATLDPPFSHTHQHQLSANPNP